MKKSEDEQNENLITDWEFKEKLDMNSYGEKIIIFEAGDQKILLGFNGWPLWRWGCFLRIPLPSSTRHFSLLPLCFRHQKWNSRSISRWNFVVRPKLWTQLHQISWTNSGLFLSVWCLGLIGPSKLLYQIKDPFYGYLMLNHNNFLFFNSTNVGWDFNF